MIALIAVMFWLTTYIDRLSHCSNISNLDHETFSKVEKIQDPTLGVGGFVRIWSRGGIEPSLRARTQSGPDFGLENSSSYSIRLAEVSYGETTHSLTAFFYFMYAVLIDIVSA